MAQTLHNTLTDFNQCDCGFRSTFERCWRLPILPEHEKELTGTFTDLKSTGDKYGSSATAAAFLQKFVDRSDADDSSSEKDVLWAHLDIGGPGIYSKRHEFMPQGGTGFGAALLTDVVENLSVQEIKKLSK